MFFSNLLDNFPSPIFGPSINHTNPNTEEETFSNKCAINLSQALIKAGEELKNYQGAKCWNCDENETHAIRAKEMADWLINHPEVTGSEAIELNSENYLEFISGKTGIIYFENYWQRNSDSPNTRTGDHIDIWNKNELESVGYIMTQFRLAFPGVSENYLDASDLGKSTRILFWPIK